jgi:hypothetical protein
MYAVGHFNQIIGYDRQTKSTKTYTRNNVFKFSDKAPFAVSGWSPNVQGQVNSIAVGGKGCSKVFLGGTFDKVHGTSVANIARVSATTGKVDKDFSHDANHEVESLLLTGGRLLTGGYFTSINGSPRNYYVSLDTGTGKVTSYLNLHISGHYSFHNVGINGTRVYNQQLSHAGHRLLAEGDFTKVGGKARKQIFMLSLGSSHATVTGWTSTEFNQNCYRTEPFYVRAAAWGPTDDAVFIATTGYHPNGVGVGPISTRTGLCDAVTSFPAPNQTVSHSWINYTGCDSLYSVVADSSTVYVGGHERWADNGDGCDSQGPGAIPAPGMAGFSQASGALTFNPTRARGLGADDMLLTSSGLWVASDNFADSQNCAGQGDHSGICFLAKS